MMSISKTKSRIHYNDKGERHGLLEAYHRNGNIRYKGTFIKNEPSGYWESYHYTGEIKFKRYYIL